MDLHEALKTSGWRQGSLLLDRDFDALRGSGTKDSTAPDSVGIVITHSCDLLNPDLHKCPKFEVLIGHKIDSPSGQYKKRRNPRMLHVPITNGTSQEWLEVRIEGREQFNRDLLIGKYPDVISRLQESDRRDLVPWLADSYQRAALPDTLQNLLQGSAKKLAKVYERLSCQVSDILLSVYPGGDINSGERYNIDMTLIVLKEEDARDVATRQAGEELKTIIEAAEIDIELNVLPESKAPISLLRSCHRMDLGWWSDTEGDEPHSVMTRSR